MISYFRSPGIGLDLGTANTRIHISGRGIALQEPSLALVRNSTGRVEAVGRDADAARGRTPGRSRTVRPVHGGRVVDPLLYERMLRHFFARAGASRPFRRIRTAAVAVTAESTEEERSTIIRSLQAAGAVDVLLVDQPAAAAYGSGLPVNETRPRLVVDLGAGITEIAILSQGTAAYARTLPIGGDDLDASIASYVRSRHGLVIGERTAEQLKIVLGSAMPASVRTRMRVKGRCQRRGVPREIAVSSCEVCEALDGPLCLIVDGIRRVLELSPPDFRAGLMETGILLTGGSALLTHLDRRISLGSGLPVQVADSPMDSVAIGLGYRLQFHAQARGRFRSDAIQRRGL